MSFSHLHFLALVSLGAHHFHTTGPYPPPADLPPWSLVFSAFQFLICRDLNSYLWHVGKHFKLLIQYVFETANQRFFHMESRGKGIREQSQTLKRPQKKTTHSSQLTIFNTVLNQYRECFKSQAMVQILACPFTRSVTLNKSTLIFECQVSLSVGKVGELIPHQVVEE